MSLKSISIYGALSKTVYVMNLLDGSKVITDFKSSPSSFCTGLMSVNSKHYNPHPPPATPGHLIKNHARGPDFAHTNCPRGPRFDRGWEVARIQRTGLIPTQIAFSVFTQSTKQNLLSVLRTVKYAATFCN